MVDDKVVEEGKIFALVGYIGILCLIPLLLKKDNKFAYHHGKQGLVLFIAEIGAGIVGIIPVIGWLVAFAVGVGCLVLSLMGIIQCLGGNYWRAPFVADFADKIKI